MAELKERLRADLNTAMRARDQVRMRTLRMALSSITNEEVAGASARELSDEEIVRVLTREARKRREAAEAFDAAGRDEQAAAERAEGGVLAGYLPAQLSDEELAALVSAAIADAGATSMKGMGQVMKTLTPRVAGRADGARVAAEVRRRLTAAGLAPQA
ncbi:MAG: GatB/YqeY domain-containing protein [Actinobacteria bacterium]|nr:GatB/YqeY domain-containing protein [Actinomycetota bacterium]